ncbi:MAG TPA: choice-of-anchor D domain-containing protein, partial [Kofleriaceae bacterium]|nr:choice-of-anchor D domain-containing protein [Kofleriaceae bacterium]
MRTPAALGTLLALVVCPSLAAAQVTADPDPLDFGPVRVGTPANQTQRTVALTNTTAFPVAIASCALTPVDPPAPDNDLIVVSCPTSIGVGATVNMAVRFPPRARGTQSASVAVDYEVQSDPVEPGSVPVGLTGTGVAPVMEVSIVPGAPLPLDFGTAVVGDASPTTYTIRVANTSDDPGDAVLDATLAESGNTGDWSFAPPDAAFALAAGQARDIVATFTPQAAGARAATITIADGDALSPVSSVPIDVVGNGDPPLIGVGISPTALAFGSIDVQVGEPVTRIVTVSNPGNRALVLAPIRLEAIDGTPYDGAAFEVLTAAPVTVEPGAQAEIEVRYQPALESAGDFAVLALGTNVVETPEVQVTLSGRGVDRHIDVSPLQMSFVPTYRNPAVPPQATLDVTNTGETPLVLGDLTVDAEGPAAESFSVIGQLADVIAPGETSSVVVEFHPRAAPEQPLQAALLIVNDDDSRPIVRVDLSGMGLLPPISASISSIEWGSIAVGQERPLPGSPLVLRNESASETFLIQDVRVADAAGEPIDAVAVAGFAQPVELAPGAELDLDVAFAPHRGVVLDGAAIEVLVGVDPEPVVRVPLSGAAIDTDALGGAGCASAGRPSAPAAWLLAIPAMVLGLGLGLGVGRGRGRGRGGRRRRRRGSRAIAAGALLLAWAGVAAPASAQVQASEDVDLSTFRPVHGVDPAMVTVESADVGRPDSGALELGFDYARNPLILRAADGEMTDHPVSARTTVELAGAYAFGDRFEVAAVVPFLSQRGEAPQFSGIAPAEGSALGDIRVRGKALLGGRAGLTFGAAAELTLPTAADKQFTGEEGPAAMLRGLADYRIGRLHLAVNGGAIMREGVRLANVQQGHAAVYGAASAVQLASRLYAVAELFGSVDLSGGPSGNRPLEAVLATRVRVTREIGVLAGAGRGVVAGVGAPEARFFFALGWSPGARAIVHPGDDPRGALDDDGDGILNRDDRCPGSPEDVDGFRDTDGCPDRDNDGDGIADKDDKCPNQAEDIDGF